MANYIWQLTLRGHDKAGEICVHSFHWKLQLIYTQRRKKFSFQDSFDPEETMVTVTFSVGLSETEVMHTMLEQYKIFQKSETLWI